MEEKKNDLLRIENLSVNFNTNRGPLKAVNDVTLTVGLNESVALIGESGSGKTTLASSIINTLPLNARISSGKIQYHSRKFNEIDLLKTGKKRFREVLWEDIAMMFQASQSSFNPVKRIKFDFMDTFKAHNRKIDEKKIMERSVELLELVMLDSKKVLNSFPHELSGGMKQRALLALSLLLDPRLIILDEPTTALDLLTQEKVVTLLKILKEKYKLSYLFISHDLSIVTELADTVAVMYAGRIIEIASVEDFFRNPKHPYSLGLIQAVPRLSMKNTKLYSIPGSPPDLIEITEGCPFAPRCSRKTDQCVEEMPPLESVDHAKHKVACWHPLKGGEM